MENDVEFDAADYSVIVKNRGPATKPWKWEITAAGKSRHIQQSAESFESMSAAMRAGKAALRRFLDRQAA
jgi:hypothetical protein